MCFHGKKCVWFRIINELQQIRRSIMSNTQALQNLTAAVGELEAQQAAVLAALQNGQGATDAELQPLADRVTAVAAALKSAVGG